MKFYKEKGALENKNIQNLKMKYIYLKIERDYFLTFQVTIKKTFKL